MGSVFGLAVNVRSIAKKGTWSVIDQGLASGANAVLSIVLARALGPTDFGAYWLAYSVYLLAMPIHGALLVEPMLVFGAGRYDDRWSRYFSLIIKGHLLLSVALTLLLLLGGVVTAYLQPGVFAQALIVLGLMAPLLLFQVLVRRACYVVRQPRLAAVTGIFYFIAVVGGALILQWFEALTAPMSLLLMGVTGFGSVAWLAPRIATLQFRPERDGFAGEVFRHHVDYGRWAVGYRLLRWIPNNLPFVLLPIFGSLGATGTLRAMQVIFMPIAQAISAISAIIVPNLARVVNNKQDFGRKVWGAFVATLLAAILYGALAGFGGDRLLYVLYGDEYAGMGWLLWILGAGMVIGVGREILSAAMRAIERPDVVFKTGVISTILFVVLGTAMIALYGIVGAAYAVIVPAVIQLVLLLRSLASQLERGSVQASVVRPVVTAQTVPDGQDV